ncbi:MAG: AAA family ATPase [Planctomycetota bacterium]
MINHLAISGYRSLKDIVLGLGFLNLVTGPNGSGKSNLYRGLRLLADCANGRLIQSLAMEGGLQSTLWAGPEKFSREMITGEIPVQGAAKRNKPIALKLGFSSDEFSYSIDLGLPVPGMTAFGRDPIIKRECVWRGRNREARSMIADRKGNQFRVRPDRTWVDVDLPLATHSSVLSEFVNPEVAPEMMLLREMVRSWRFYDHFRSDKDAPSRQMQIGTYSPVLSDDGSNLAATLQTIIESGNEIGLRAAIEDAFPGSDLVISTESTRFEVLLRQNGMLRALAAAELSDGTLRYLLLVAAIFTLQPPELMVLNEPETSLHPDLIPALGRLICNYASQNQIIVVTHSHTLVDALLDEPDCVHFQLEKSFGATQLYGIDPFDIPVWNWPRR